MLTYIQIIHCLNNKTKYMYTEHLQLLKKIWAAKKTTMVNFIPGNIKKPKSYFAYL